MLRKRVDHTYINLLHCLHLYKLSSTHCGRVYWHNEHDESPNLFRADLSTNTMNAQSFYQQGNISHAASQHVQSVNMASLMLVPGQQQADANMFIQHTNKSPAAGPEKSKASPGPSSSMEHHWDVSFSSVADGECIGCGRRYGLVEELVDHQRIDHGLTDAVF